MTLTRFTSGGAWLAVAALAAVAAGCDGWVGAETAVLRDTLRVSIERVERSSSGQVELSLAMLNAGSTTARACLGPSHDFSVDAGERTLSSMVTVSHPGCQREFAIAPGEVLRWREALDLEAPIETWTHVRGTIEVLKMPCRWWERCRLDLTVAPRALK